MTGFVLLNHETVDAVLCATLLARFRSGFRRAGVVSLCRVLFEAFVAGLASVSGPSVKLLRRTRRERLRENRGQLLPQREHGCEEIADFLDSFDRGGGREKER